jgi:2-methylisocitrate lyase-like PEP mutase family enzyme
MASKAKTAAAAAVPTATFRQLAETEKPFVLPGVHDGLSARLAELAGFKGVFMGGFGSLGARHAVPDVGLMGLADISAIARDVRAATSLPFMVDADDGYGDAKNVAHTVRTYERLGAQAIFLEDQVSPKRCGHLAGKRIVSAERMVTKIRAAAAERTSLFIVARTDARSVVGMDEALRRGERYLRAGADAIYIESPESVAELEQCGRAFEALNMTSMLEGGKTPILKPSELYGMGSTS